MATPWSARLDPQDQGRYDGVRSPTNPSPLRDLQDLRTLEMTELDSPTFNARTNEGERRLKFRMEIALDNLRGNGCGTQAQLFANCPQ